MKLVSILDTSVHDISIGAALEWADSLLSSGNCHQIITANALLILEAQRNSALRMACTDAALVLPESAGTCWALSLLTHHKVESMTGIDFAYTLCQKAAEKSLPVYFLGGGPGVSRLAAAKLKQSIPNLIVAGSSDGFFNIDQEQMIINNIKETGARLVLVAMGMPKQDTWISSRRQILPPALYIGIGGSFDVWAGNVKRAPKWMQIRGLEWLYRLYQEPWRFSRIALLPVFFFKVLGQRFNQFATIRPR